MEMTTLKWLFAKERVGGRGSRLLLGVRFVSRHDWITDSVLGSQGGGLRHRIVGWSSECLSVLVPLMHLSLHQQGGLDGLSRPWFCSPTRPIKKLAVLCMKRDTAAGILWVRSEWRKTRCTHSIGRSRPKMRRYHKENDERASKTGERRRLQHKQLPPLHDLHVDRIDRRAQDKTTTESSRGGTDAAGGRTNGDFAVCCGVKLAGYEKADAKFQSS